MGDKYFATYVQDLEPESFDAVGLVEKIAWRIMGGATTTVDAQQLRRGFEHEIGCLQMLTEQFQSRINMIEQSLRADKRELLDTLYRLYDRNTEATAKLKHVDDVVSTVAAKVVYLGDQLEGADAPRQRATEALALIRHLDAFLAEQPVTAEIFTDPDKLLEAADLLQKLNAVAQELGDDRKQLQARINARYVEVEGLVVEEFVRALRVGDTRRMTDAAKTLQHFNGYSECVERYVEQVASNSMNSATTDPYADVQALCIQIRPNAEKIFPNPQHVMQKLVLHLFHGRLQDHVLARQETCEKDAEAVLAVLCASYQSSARLCDSLVQQRVADAAWLSHVQKSVWTKHLVAYPAKELVQLEDQARQSLAEYYESMKHQKRSAGMLGEMRRDMAARFMTVSDVGPSLLSEELAIALLQHTRSACGRIKVLCPKPDERATLVERVLQLLLKYLCTEHLDYAVEVALAAIPLGEPRSEPPAHFYAVVQQNTAIVHLLSKQLDDSLFPLLKDTVAEANCLKMREKALGELETKLNEGLTRQLNAVAGWTRVLLANDKTDFKVDDNPNIDISRCSDACTSVSNFLQSQVKTLCDGTDGGNRTTLLLELAKKFYDTLLAWVQQHVYSTTGALLLLADLNKYKSMSAALHWNEATRRLERLHTLAGLLVAMPDGLTSVVHALQLDEHGRALVKTFVAMRADAKSIRMLPALFSSAALPFFE